MKKFRALALLFTAIAGTSPIYNKDRLDRFKERYDRHKGSESGIWSR